jgi:hypothetical protein
METESHSTTDKNSLLKNNRMALRAAVWQAFKIFVALQKCTPATSLSQM